MATEPVPPSTWLRTTPSIVYTFDPAGVCTMSEGPGLAALGLQPGELVGTNLLEAYAADPAVLANLRRALAGESFVVDQAHEGRILETFLQPMSVSASGRTGGLGVVSDVTEQRRLEREANEQGQRMRALVDLDAALALDVVDLPALLDTAVSSTAEGTSSSGALWLTSHDDPSRLRVVALKAAVDPHGVPLVPSPDRVRPEVLEVDRAMVEAIPRAHHFAFATLDTTEFFGSPSVGSWLRDTGAHSVLRVPLRARGNLLGALDLVRRTGTPHFSEKDTDFCVDVADRVALALDNGLLLRAQRESLEEQVKFRALIDATSDLIAITDTDAVTTYVNDRISSLGAFWVGKTLQDIFARNVGEDVLDEVEQRLVSDGRWRGDLTLIGPTGEMVARTEAFHIFHPDTDAALGTGWVAEDVTELRAAEQALRAANVDLMRFKALVEACPDFVAIAALDGTVLYVNPPGRAMVGLAPDRDVTRMRIADFLTEEGLAASVDVEQPTVIAHGFFEGESTLRDMRGGPAIPVQVASFLVRDPESGEPFALATIQRDLTDRLAAEAALRDLAEQRQRLLARLVDVQEAERAHIAAEVHDDSVQALAAVDLRLGLLSRRVAEDAPHLTEHLSPLQQAVSAATDRLRTLLFDLTPVDLEHGLAAALRETAREIFDDTSTEVVVVEPELGSEPSEAPAPSPSSLRVAHRIAKEALFNVRKHARAERVTLTVGSHDGGLALSVVDNGVGIADDQVFSVAGHLGLSSMHDRAEIAGGEWSVARRAEGGTEVTLWLPPDSDRTSPDRSTTTPLPRE